MTGIWHGSRWNFVFWGWMYFAVLVIEKKCSITKHLNTRIKRVLYRIVTLLIVNFGWVLFRAKDLNTALLYIGKMLGMKGAVFADARTWYILGDNIVLLGLAAVFSVPVAQILSSQVKTEKLEGIVKIFEYVFLVGVLVACIASIASSSYNPFIYFDF